MKTVESRFWPKVHKTENCWLWTGAKNSQGYGNFWDGMNYIHAHRASWIIKYGDIPSGMCVLHRCDVPLCINPDHLWIGTKGDNNKDRSAKGRNGDCACPGTKNGRAKLTEADVRAIREKYKTGLYYQYLLAEEYGVVQTTISSITRRRLWPDLL